MGLNSFGFEMSVFKHAISYLYTSLLLAVFVIAIKGVYELGFARTGSRRRAQVRI